LSPLGSGDGSLLASPELSSFLLVNLSGHQRCCHIFFHLLLRLPAVVNVVVVILILLLLLPLSVLLIKDIRIQCRENQLMFVYCTSICRKMIWG
jgi:hypothetical protein